MPSEIWRKARRMVTSGALRMYIVFLKQLEERKSAAMEAIREGRVVIGDIDAEEYVPVTKQGDLSHYTSIAILERNALATSAKLIDTVKTHFTALTDHKPAGRRWVTREQYIRYFMLCYSVLYPDSGMTESQQRSALNDEWCNDAGDTPAMTFATFYRSVFEMLDHWCDSVNEAEYVATAETIGKRVLDDKVKGLWFTNDDPAGHVTKPAVLETGSTLPVPILPLPVAVKDDLEVESEVVKDQPEGRLQLEVAIEVVARDVDVEPRKLDEGIGTRARISRKRDKAKDPQETKPTPPKPEPTVEPEPKTTILKPVSTKLKSKAEIIDEEHKNHREHAVNGYCEQCAILKQLREEELQLKIALREAMHAQSTEIPWKNAWGAEVERTPFKYEADPYQDVPENPLARDFDGPSFLTGKGTWEQALPPLPPKEKRSYIVSPITRPRRLQRDPTTRTGTVAAVLKGSGAKKEDSSCSPTMYQSSRHEIGVPSNSLISPFTVERVALKPRSYMDEIDLLDVSETSRSSQTTLSSYRSDASKSYWPSSLPAMKRGSSGASTPKSGPVRSVAASSKAAATKFWSKEFQRQFQIPVQLGHVHQLEASSHSRLSPLVLDAASAAQQSVSSSTLAKLASPPEPGFPVKRPFLSPIQRTHSYRLLPVTGSKGYGRK